MSTKPRILVTSAAGRTGAAAVSELLAQGFPVRAFVRREDARSDKLKQAGAEIFTGDLFDMRDLREALVDVQRAYHVPPFAPNLLQGTMLFALAAEEARLETLALMSGWNGHPSHPSALTREHWITNNIVQWMPTVDVTYINPGIFAFFYLTGLPAIKHLGMLALPFGDGLNAPPSNEDIGAVAAGVLADPVPHIGKTYRPTGPELLSGHDVAEILSRVVDRKVSHRDVSTNMFIKAATALGMSPFEVSQIRTYAEDLRRGAFAVGAPTNHVQEVTGRPPEDFETIARRYIANPSLILPGFSAGSKLGAVAGMVKMMLTRLTDFDRWEADRGHAMLKGPQFATDSNEWKVAAEQQTLALLDSSATAAAPRTPAVGRGPRDRARTRPSGIIFET
ncbi:MAG: NmrA family NAD(P)-binding protein [Gemmatimonadetes bacterium]|nr:NmrA family NAD(P)-binding protein [Gemmatimonadota bacterium]